jgi:hypothetical protein
MDKRKFELMSAEEKLDTQPSHYHSQPFKSDVVQETIFENVRNGEIYAEISSEDETRAAVKAMWVSFAVKHLLRAGLKDDVNCELLKAENYLHKARTGQWIK